MKWEERGGRSQDENRLIFRNRTLNVKPSSVAKWYPRVSLKRNPISISLTSDYFREKEMFVYLP